jgi:hypothetical protein
MYSCVVATARAFHDPSSSALSSSKTAPRLAVPTIFPATVRALSSSLLHHYILSCHADLLTNSCLDALASVSVAPTCLAGNTRSTSSYVSLARARPRLPLPRITSMVLTASNL